MVVKPIPNSAPLVMGQRRKTRSLKAFIISVKQQQCATASFYSDNNSKSSHRWSRINASSWFSCMIRISIGHMSWTPVSLLLLAVCFCMSVGSCWTPHRCSSWSTSKVSAIRRPPTTSSRLSTQWWCLSFHQVSRPLWLTCSFTNSERRRVIRTWAWPSWTRLWRDWSWLLASVMMSMCIRPLSSGCVLGFFTWLRHRFLRDIGSMTLLKLYRFMAYADSLAFSMLAFSETSTVLSQLQRAPSDSLASKSLEPPQFLPGEPS